MELLGNLENVLKETNKFINIDEERQKYTKHCDHVRDSIFNELRKNFVLSELFNGFHLSGNYGDNLKVSKPDEFDVHFAIQFPEHSLIDVKEDPQLPGNVLLNFNRVMEELQRKRPNGNDNLRKCMDFENYLIVENLQRFIQIEFEKVIDNMQNRIYYNGKLARLCYRRRGVAHTILVAEVYNGGYYFKKSHLKYSIDFVPVILLTEQQHVIPIKGQWEAIPNPSKTYVSNFRSFRASYYQQEHELINDKQQLKNAFRMMMNLRDVHSEMSAMKNYFIKTLFLHEVSKEPDSYWEKPLQEIIIDMLKEMEESFLEGVLPFYWNKKLNLYKDFNPSLLREFLNCVQTSRKMLEKAAINFTKDEQDNILKIFLNYFDRAELQKLKNPKSDYYW